MIEIRKEIKLMPYGAEYCGKHNGWAFQLLNDNYEGFYLGVCCKDYLLDIVWSDLTQKSMTAHGQQSDYKGIIDKQTTLKLVMYPYMFNGLNEPKIEELEQLMVNLQGFINEIELLMNIEELSLFEYSDNKIVIEFSKKWIDKPYLLSLYTLLCRIGVYYDGNLEEYLKNPYTAERKYLDTCDSYYMKLHYQKLLDIFNGKAIIEQPDWKDLQPGGQVHNSGIFSWINKIKYKENDINIDQTKKES